MKIAHSEIYSHPLKDGHRFPMVKYDLLPKQLLLEGIVKEGDFFEPFLISDSDLLAIHSLEYVKNCEKGTVEEKEWRKIGFPYSKKLIEREKIIMQGSIMASEFALEEGIAFNIAGGTHHSFKDKGEGFCIFNDIALSTKYLQNHHKIKNILVIDLDVHQGNGTAKIFENDSSVFTFSMHGRKNYPFFKEQSDLDLELEDGTEDDKYIYYLKTSLDKILKIFNPNFIIYQSGVDILYSDKLGKLNISLSGLRQRDEVVIKLSKELNIPMMVCMGGGYSEEISLIIEAHKQIFELASMYY